MANDPNEEVDQSFSYENDITPLRRQYFDIARNTGLPVSAQAQLVRGSINELQQEKEQELQLQQRAINFEATKLELEKSRRESSSKIGNMQRIAELQSILSTAMSGNVTDVDRPKIVSQIGIQYAPLIGTNEIAKTMFTSAQKGVTGSSRSSSNDQFEMAKSFMNDLDSVKLAKDYAGKPVDEFEDEGSFGKVSTVIDLFGTPELQAQAAEATAKEKLGIARKIRTDYYKSAMQGQSATQGPTTQSPRSLFKKSPTVNPLLGTPP